MRVQLLWVNNQDKESKNWINFIQIASFHPESSNHNLSPNIVYFPNLFYIK